MHGIQFIRLNGIHERCLGASCPLMMPNMMLPVAGRSEEGVVIRALWTGDLLGASLMLACLSSLGFRKGKWCSARPEERQLWCQHLCLFHNMLPLSRVRAFWTSGYISCPHRRSNVFSTLQVLCQSPGTKSRWKIHQIHKHREESIFCSPKTTVCRPLQTLSHVTLQRNYATATPGTGRTDRSLEPGIKYCRKCGGAMHTVVPDGDNRIRSVCSTCSFIDYVNPRLVVGAIIEHQGQILLCKRGIQPQKGLWTVPAGYLEVGESSVQGAVRETMEEAAATIQILAPYCHYDIVNIGQAYLLFRAKLVAPYEFAPCQPESLEARLFSPSNLPFDKIAFSSVSLALKAYVSDIENGTFPFRHGTIIKQSGSGPNDPGTYQLVDMFTV